MDAHRITTSLDPSSGSAAGGGRRAFEEEWDHMHALVEGAREADLYFYFRSIETPQGPRVSSNGRELMLFASNNYLGLANHPLMKQRAIEATERYGTGVCGTQLLNGNTVLHQALEQALATFKGTEAAMVFSTGYQCNVGTISALVGEGDLVVSDKLNHASILDGCKLSGAELRLFPHNRTRKLRQILERSGGYRKKLIVVDGVYSMEGDLADLPTISELARHHDALLMVDEAHATGVIGPRGRGTVEHFGLSDRVDVVMGTMSKTLASVGGFIAGSRTLVNYLKHTARSYLFSAALPPSVVETARTALELIDAEPWRRERLWANTTRLRNGLRTLGFDTLASETPLIPILIEDPYKVSTMARALQDEGLFVCAIFPPAVPPNRSRLRLHVSAEHTRAHIDAALAILECAGRRTEVLH
jgi:8-amino-7-oxononanoate synthase